MRIGQLSARSGVRAHLLRYYETQGLLERGANGYRDYPEEAVVTVAQIRGLLAAGLSTSEIRQLLPCASGAAPDLQPCPKLLATLQARPRGLDDRIAALTNSCRALRRYLPRARRRTCAFSCAPSAGSSRPGFSISRRVREITVASWGRSHQARRPDTESTRNATFGAKSRTGPPVERLVAHFKAWRIFHTDYRRPYRTYRDAYDAARGLFFFSITWGFE
jgi:DNA-binding transcriptional MerR regulator